MPDLALPTEEQVEVGIWGQRHLQYIKVHRRGFYTTLLTKCELNRHLADVNEQAEDMFFRLVKQMAEREGVTEQLKVDHQMEWVARMNNICSRATEIVNSELIYTDTHANTFAQKVCPTPLTDNIPKVFWKYFDLYRRKQITLQEYVNKTGLEQYEILHYLSVLKKNVREKLLEMLGYNR